MTIHASRTLCCLFALLSISSQYARAMEQTDDIDTNRPSFMFSPLVLPKGSLQLENGTLYQHFDHGITYWDASETQVRVGITRQAEFEMFVPNFVLQHQAHTDIYEAGASDLSEVGIKYQLPTIQKFQPTLIAAMNIPTGSKTISGSGVEPFFRAPWSYPIKTWSIMGMQSLLVLNSGRNTQYQNNFMITKSITPRTGVFTEYEGVFTHHANGFSIMHFGAIWKIARDHQVDIQWGFGLNKSAPAALVGAGYSFRLDGLPWSSSK
jgi:hypothetical protein